MIKKLKKVRFALAERGGAANRRANITRVGVITGMETKRPKGTVKSTTPLKGLVSLSRNENKRIQEP